MPIFTEVLHRITRKNLSPEKFAICLLLYFRGKGSIYWDIFYQILKLA